MTLIDFTQTLEWLEDRYGALGPAWKRPDRVFDDFGQFTAGAMKEAANDWYKSGEPFAPKPSQLLKLVVSVSHERQARGEDPVVERKCTGKHVWALAGATGLDPRTDICALCHTERRPLKCDHSWGDQGCHYCPLDKPTAEL